MALQKLSVKSFILLPAIFLFIGNIARSQFKYSFLFSNSTASFQNNDFLKLYYSNRNYKPLPVINFLPDTAKKLKTKNCFNSWCCGTSAVPLLSLVSFNSFLMNEKVKLKGLKFGAEIGERVRFGIGWYKLDNPIKLSPLINDFDTVNRQFQFEIFNFFAEYIFYEDFRWELSLPFSIGKAVGKIDTFSVRNNNLHGQTNADSTGISTVGFDFEYRFIPWLGLGGGVGYRQAFAPKDIREKLNAPYYVVKVKIFIGYLFKAIFMKKKLAEEREAYKREKEERKKKRKEKREKKEIGEEVDKVEGIDKPGNNKDY